MKMHPVLTQFAKQIQDGKWARAEEPSAMLTPLAAVVAKDALDAERIANELQVELTAELVRLPKYSEDIAKRLAFTTAGGKRVVVLLDETPSSDILAMFRQMSDFNDISAAGDSKRKYLHPASRVVVVFPVALWQQQASFPFIDLFDLVCRADLA